MPRDELYDAANLCEKCFTCRYAVESLRVIRCTLHGKIENEPYPKILPDCKFFLRCPPNRNLSRTHRELSLKSYLMK